MRTRFVCWLSGLFFFFFSSRRRHTRLVSDWSSDVCSSDLNSYRIPPLNATLMNLASGTRLGRYEIRSPLGAGGMGEVYLAQDTKLDRKVEIGRASCRERV